MSGQQENEGKRTREQLVEMQTLENDSRCKGKTRIDAEEQALAESTLHNPLTRTKELTDLGGDPVTLRASISMLSVLLLVSDSELEDGSGSIGVGCVLSRPGKEKYLFTDAWQTRGEQRS
jgi:hypothetical protein